MSAIRNLAVAERIVVLATIHQPSLETLAQFTNLVLLAEGKTCYSGRVDELEGFFEMWGQPVSRFVRISDGLTIFPASDIQPRLHPPSMQ
jgi:ABC-type multidrug transport system ATPase subunit